MRRVSRAILFASCVLVVLAAIRLAGPPSEHRHDPAPISSGERHSGDGPSPDGPSPHAPASEEPPTHSTPQGRLVAAAGAGDLEQARQLLSSGVDPDARDARGYGPLHQAAAQDAPEIIRLLLQHGADLDAPDRIGWSPLTWGAFFGSRASVEEMLARGADPNAIHPPNHVTPLIQLVAGWHMAKDEAPQAPPFREVDRVEIARRLLQAGADPDLEGANGRPMDTVLFMNNHELLRAFVEAGAKFEDLPYIHYFLEGRGPVADLLRHASSNRRPRSPNP